MNDVISYVRSKNARFFFLSDKQIIGLLTSIFSKAEYSMLILECFRGIKSINLEDNENEIIILNLVNNYDENIFP